MIRYWLRKSNNQPKQSLWITSERKGVRFNTDDAWKMLQGLVSHFYSKKNNLVVQRRGKDWCQQMLWRCEIGTVFWLFKPSFPATLPCKNSDFVIDRIFYVIRLQKLDMWKISAWCLPCCPLLVQSLSRCQACHKSLTRCPFLEFNIVW